MELESERIVMKKKVTKGSYEYLKNRKVQTVLWTVLLFAVSATLFIAGVVTTGTKKNLLTIVAVLGVLPATRSFVTSFMYCKAKGCSAQWYEEHHELMEQFKHGYYDLVFTTYERAYNVPVLVIKEGNVCGLTYDSKKPIKELEAHVESSLKKEKRNANVVIFDKEEDFLKRVEQMVQLEEKEPNKHADRARILFEISL